MLSLLSLALAVHCAICVQATQFGLPWSTQGSRIVNAQKQDISLAGVNWSGSLELMLPEGLQYSSAGDIVAKIKSLGFNAVRHTFAIEMIDDIIDGGHDVSIYDSAVKALGQEAGNAIANKIVQNNQKHGFTLNTTRLEVLATIANLEEQAGILMHLDNHMSTAKWCCAGNDGNAFFGDSQFDVDKWKRGLVYMATWAKQRRNVASIALRNELRKPSQANSKIPYGWPSWVRFMPEAAEAVHQANADLLIFFSGLDSDTNLGDVVNGKTTFKFKDVSYSSKLVFELHRYEKQTCDSTFYSLFYSGFSATGMPQPKLCNNNCPRPIANAPVLLTEIGTNIDLSQAEDVLKCFRDFTLTADPNHTISWFLWTLQGSYYTHTGVKDQDEAYGILNHNWSAWRRSNFTDLYLKPWIVKTKPSSFA